jgi:hypothetical protein
MENNIKIPVWYWVVSILALLWNLMGVSAFFMQVMITPEQIQEMTEAEQALYAAYPSWMIVIFALAVFGSTLGSIGLLMKKKWSKPVFLVALLAIISQMYYNLLVAKTTAVYGPGAAVMPIMIIVFAVLLLWLSNKAVKKNWLN